MKTPTQETAGSPKINASCKASRAILADLSFVCDTYQAGCSTQTDVFRKGVEVAKHLTNQELNCFAKGAKAQADFA